jgi:hypothetical protein
MRGYPKHIATKQDFENLLAMPEHKDQALADLKAICLLGDDKAMRATKLIDPENPEKGSETEEIDNPLPVWKQKGFTSRADVADLITANGGKI